MSELAWLDYAEHGDVVDEMRGMNMYPASMLLSWNVNMGLSLCSNRGLFFNMGASVLKLFGSAVALQSN